MRFWLGYLISISLIIPSQSWAQLSQAAQVAEEVVVAEEVAQIGAKTAVQEFTENGGLTYKLLNSESKIISQFEIPKATPQLLEAAKPSNIFASSKKLAKLAGAATLSQLKRFPIEAFTFFIALGAVSTQDLIFNYNQNPTAYDDLISGQKDPISQIGFAAFMMGNGATTQPLAAIFKSPRLHAMLPYLGMSVGMTASKIVGEVGHIPGLLQCARSLRFNKEACDSAYEAWQKFSFAQQGIQMMPGLTAMLLTTLIIGAGQQILEKLAVKAAGYIVKVLAVNVLLSCNPAGWVVRGVQVLFWGWQVLQIVGFLDTSNYIEIPLTRFWNNTVVLGPGLVKHKRLLADAAISGNVNGVGKSIDKFADLMQKWRENSSMDILTAHNHWLNYLSKMSAEYNISKVFYSALLNDIWLTTFHPNQPDHANILRKFPLYGVSAPDGQKIPFAKYFALTGMQDSIEEDQVQTLHNVANVIASTVKSNPDKFSKLPVEERQFILGLNTDFASNDLQKMAAGLNQINRALKLVPAEYSYIMAESYSPSLLAFLKNLRPLIGEAFPSDVPGEGYLKALDSYYREQGLIDPFANRDRGTSTPIATEALVLKMFSGPDVETASLIDTTWTGFKSHFIPPKVTWVRDFVTYNMQDNGRGHVGPDPDIFHVQFAMDPRMFHYPDMKTNMMTELLNDKIQPEILGDARGANVDRWWTAKVEPQYISAWIDFEGKYEEIIKLLYHDLWKDDWNPSNYTGLSNGIVRATHQEIEVYLNLLAPFSHSYHDYSTARKGMAETITQLEILLKNIKLSTKQYIDSNGNPVLVSRISNQDLDARKQDFDGKLKAFTDSLLAQPGNSDKERHQIIMSLNEKLTNAFASLVDYGKIVNIVSYKERYAQGTDAGAKCIKSQAGPTTADTLRGALQACPQN